MTNQKVLVNGVALLSALTELLRLKRLDVEEAEGISMNDVQLEIAQDYGVIMKNATKMALEFVSQYANGNICLVGPNMPVNRQINTGQLELHFDEEKANVDRIVKSSKVVVTAEKGNTKEIIQSLPLRDNLAEKSYTNVFKNNLKATAEKKDLSYEDLFTEETLATPFTKLVMRTIISYLEDGKRGECVGYLVSYVFKHKGMNEVDAHRLLNQLKDHYGIVEKSKMRNAVNKRPDQGTPVIPKGKYLWAEYTTFKSIKGGKVVPVEGVVIWPSKSINNSILDGTGEFICMEKDILKYREATRSEIDIFVNKATETKLEAARKIWLARQKKNKQMTA